MGKMTKTPFSVSDSVRKTPLGLIHMDLMGPIESESINKKKYALVLVDDHTRYVWIRFLRKKNEAEAVIRAWFAQVERQFDTKVKAFRSDRGGEFLANTFRIWLTSNGVLHELSCAYTPEQNGVAENTNRTLGDRTRSILYESGLPTRYWEHAMQYVCWLKNRSPTIKVKNKTPFEALYGEKPSLGLARVFGCMAQVWIHKSFRSGKFGPHAKWAIFLGVADDGNESSKGWIFQYMTDNKLGVSRHAHFHEEMFYKQWKKAGFDTSHDQLEHEEDDEYEQLFSTHYYVPTSFKSSEVESESRNQPEESPQVTPQVEIPPEPRIDSITKPDRKSTPIQTLQSGLDYLGVGSNVTKDRDPQPNKIVIMNDDAPIEGEPNENPLLNQSIEIIEDEISAHEIIDTEELEPPPIDPKVQESLDQLRKIVDELNQPIESVTAPPLEDDPDENGRRYPLRNRTPAMVYSPASGQTRPIGSVKELVYYPAEGGWGFIYNTQGYTRPRKPSKHLSTYTDLPEPPKGRPPEDYEFPQTLHKALTDPYRKKWKEAIEKEHGQIKERRVYEVVKPPPGAKIMDSKWVFVVKYNVDKTVDKFKARLCAKGFTSIPGVHHNETFAPTASYAAARMMFALAATCNAEIDQMDVSGAFLYGDLDEEIYMRPPPGLEEPDGKVWRLGKSLYGLKQAPRTWNKALQKVLFEEGFVQSKIEPTLYILHRDGESLYTLVFVDDLLMVSTCSRLSSRIKDKLMSRFDMTDLGAC